MKLNMANKRQYSSGEIANLINTHLSQLILPSWYVLHAFGNIVPMIIGFTWIIYEIRAVSAMTVGTLSAASFVRGLQAC